MSTAVTLNGWFRWRSAGLRIAAVFIGLLALPLDWKFYRLLTQLDWRQFQDWFQVTAYLPQFLPPIGWLGSLEIGGYANVGVAAVLALVGGLVWTALDREQAHEETIAYWIRVILRYRLALALAGYGVLKIFSAQFPAPTLSDLHTPYGEFLPWKIYYLTTGIGQAYFQQTLGALELIAAALLLWRPTVVVGAGLATALLTNIVLVNFAYSIGEQVYASVLLFFTAYLLVHDTPRLFALLVREAPAEPDRFTPVFSRQNRWIRATLQVLFVGFIVGYGAVTYANQRHDRWPFPATPAVAELRGYYHVRDFSLDGVTRPESPTDTLRWRDVVFEEWNTVSVRTAASVAPDHARPLIPAISANDRDYERAGNGARTFFTYTANTNQQTIVFTQQGGGPAALALNYRIAPDGIVVLQGKDESGKAFAATLVPTNKKYLLQEGRRRPLSIY